MRMCMMEWPAALRCLVWCVDSRLVRRDVPHVRRMLVVVPLEVDKREARGFNFKMLETSSRDAVSK